MELGENDLTLRFGFARVGVSLVKVDAKVLIRVGAKGRAGPKSAKENRARLGRVW